VCSLKWSGSGKLLASGAKDGLLNIWDLSKSTPLRRFTHRAVVKAIAWCPHQSNQLASGEGVDNGCIKLWNVDAGTCLKSVETGSHVSELLWNQDEKELLSSHCHGEHQLTLWKYPSIVKMAELACDASDVTFMAEVCLLLNWFCYLKMS
jgi:cell division cycle 20, cofactor of APC complex